LPSPGELELEGVLALDQGAPESVVAAVAGGDIRAEASSRLDDRVELAGAQAVDGDPTTGWIFDEPSASIALTFPERTLDSLTIDTTVGTGFGQLSEIDVLVAGEQQRLDPTSATCDGAPQCEISHTIELGGVEASSIDITMTGPESTAETTIRVDEIRLNGQPNDTPERSGDCVTGLVEIDGEDRGVRFTTPPEVLLRGQPARFVGCVPVALGAGSHRLRSGSGVMLDRATLLPPAFAAPSPVDDAVGTVESVATDGSRVTARVDAADGGVLVVGQSYHPAWRASADGRDLGRPLSVDGLAAWQLEPAVGQEIVVEFGLQRRYEAALLVSLAGALGCCVLVVGRRQR
ncbi:MAG: hypothetical protein OEU32_11300, partial [Acidimicrobiia bacterium]|nr:hypothetical protein [Acidimicrobiia bacterium]